jgi:iron(III) transport system permease protein
VFDWLADPWRLIGLGLLVGMAIVVVYPQLWILRTSLGAPKTDAFTLENYVRFFAEARFREGLINSLIASPLAVLGSMFVAVPWAFLLARFRVPGKRTILVLVTMATVSPPFLGAYSWVILLGRSGMLSVFLRDIGIPWGSIIGPGGVVWAMIWTYYPIVFLLIYDAFTNLDPSLEEAARSVGANPWRSILNVSLPLTTPALLTSAYLALSAAFADFGTPRLIGGEFTTLPVLVYYEFLSEVGGNPAMASAASMIMVAASTLFLMLQRYLVARRSYAVVSVRRAGERPLSRWGAALLLGYSAIILLLSFTPHLVVVFTSFLTWKYGLVKWILTLDNYKELFSVSLSPILVSYFLSISSTLIAILVGLAIAYIVVRKGYRFIAPALNFMVMFPYIVPGTVLAIGLIIVFNKPPLVLTGTWIILGLSYVIRKLPYAMKAAESALYQVHPSLEEAAMSVGASSTRTFREITTPLIVPGIVSGGTMTFLAIITELSSTIMLYAAPWITMTIVIFQNALDAGAPFGIASAMTVVLMISVYVPLYLVTRVFRVQVSAL